ncbi:MAG TPA: guanylate kinase [Thermodesulfobacteriota bacterium]|nr:guanylate kinase [Thermodesulfobacteriota bacterium]
MKMRGIPFIVSGPSGAGKTTLYKKAVESLPGLRHSISYTTRTARPGDRDGVDYWFVDEAAFDRMVEAGEFIEHATVHAKRYGTSKKDLEAMLSGGVDVILEIDVQGAHNIRKRLEGGVYVFILPPSVEACRERLTTRGQDGTGEMERRLEIALQEIKRAVEYEYIIINDSAETAFEELKSIIIAERAKKERVVERVRGLFTL